MLLLLLLLFLFSLSMLISAVALLLDLFDDALLVPFLLVVVLLLGVFLLLQRKKKASSKSTGRRPGKRFRSSTSSSRPSLSGNPFRRSGPPPLLSPVAGVSGVTEALFQARRSALAEERNQLSLTAMLYSCALCGKEYRSSKAHDQHLKSRAHAMKASQESDPAIASESLTNLHVNEQNSVSGVGQSDGMDEVEDLDPSCCFICDQKHHDIESCMVHMHKLHGFFIPDVEYLKNPKGLLKYVSLKVKRDFVCLYCNERCHPFQSLEAVRKHMIAKGHCKLRYGDGGDDDDGDLEDFYDYSSSYLDADGKQLVSANDMANSIELGTGGSELIVRRRTDGGVLVRILGFREFLRYYRQKPRPSPARDIAPAISLASRNRILRLATMQTKERTVRMKVLRKMNRNGVEAMRSKIGMKSNVIRNLPKNVPY